MADESDGAALESAEPGDEGAVVRASAVTVQLDPVLEQALDIVQRVGPVRATGQLDRAPDRSSLEYGLQPLELPV